MKYGSYNEYTIIKKMKPELLVSFSPVPVLWDNRPLARLSPKIFLLAIPTGNGRCWILDIGDRHCVHLVFMWPCNDLWTGGSANFRLLPHKIISYFRPSHLLLHGISDIRINFGAASVFNWWKWGVRQIGGTGVDWGIRKIKKKLIILSRLTTLINLFQQFKSF